MLIQLPLYPADMLHALVPIHYSGVSRYTIGMGAVPYRCIEEIDILVGLAATCYTSLRPRLCMCLASSSTVLVI